MAGRFSRTVGVVAVFAALPPTSSRAAQQEPPLVEVSGSVVVDDGKGKSVSDETGTVLLGVHEGNGWRPQKAFLVEGEWKAKVPAGCQLSFELFALDDGIAYWLLDGEKPADGRSRRFGGDERRQKGLPIPPDGHLAVTARYVPPCRVHVVDAETGVELERVDALLDLCHTSDHSTYSEAHSLGKGQIYPTRWWQSDLRAHDKPSPLSLTIDLDETFPQWSEALWVHAPGHCWAGVAVDYRTGGEQTVKLSRGGVLSVKVESERLPEETKIVVRAAADAAAATTRKAPTEEGEEGKEGDDEGNDEEEGFSGFGSSDGRLLEWPFLPSQPRNFDAIPPGRYRVSLEVGDRSDKKLTFASADVEVKTGQSAVATLKVEKAPAIPELTPLNGTIHVDPAWGSVKFEVEIEPVQVSPLLRQERLRLERDQLLRDPADPTTWRLPASKVAPGTYRLQIDAFGVGHVFTVLRAAKPVAIEVGPPVDATFHFVDAKSRAPLAVERPIWSLVESANPMDEFLGGGVHFRNDKEAPPGDTHALRVPAGRIGLRVEIEDYDSFTPVVVDVSADDADVTVPLRHLTGVRILFRLDMKPVDWNEALRGEKKEVEGQRFTMLDYEPKIRRRAPAKSSEKSGDDEQAESGSGPSHGGHYLAVEHAGDYTVTLPPIQGFEPVAPRDVTIRDQEFSEIVVELVRVKK
jgi:hypothetical protein